MVQSITVTCGEQRASAYDFELKNLPVLWSAFEACGACVVPPERWDAFVNVGLPFARAPYDYVLSIEHGTLYEGYELDIAVRLSLLERRLKHPEIEALRYFGVPEDHLARLTTVYELYYDRIQLQMARLYLLKLLPRDMAVAKSEAQFLSAATAEWMRSKNLGAVNLPLMWRLVRPPLDVRAELQAVVDEHADLEAASEELARQRCATLEPQAALAKELLALL